MEGNKEKETPWNKIEIYNTETKEHISIDIFEFRQIIMGLSFKSARMPDESIHTWIAEGDGSCKRFIDFINSFRNHGNKQ